MRLGIWRLSVVHFSKKSNKISLLCNTIYLGAQSTRENIDYVLQHLPLVRILKFFVSYSRVFIIVYLEQDKHESPLDT